MAAFDDNAVVCHAPQRVPGSACGCAKIKKYAAAKTPDDIYNNPSS
jgi:hypothetical protein